MTHWGEMLRTAMRQGVTPDRFWRLSLREWRMLTARPEGLAPMRREDLMRMAEGWPDDGGGGVSLSTASRSSSQSLRGREET